MLCFEPGQKCGATSIMLRLVSLSVLSSLCCHGSKAADNGSRPKPVIITNSFPLRSAEILCPPFLPFLLSPFPFLLELESLLSSHRIDAAVLVGYLSSQDTTIGQRKSTEESAGYLVEGSEKYCSRCVNLRVQVVNAITLNLRI